jgi:hypothetical protein
MIKKKSFAMLVILSILSMILLSGCGAGDAGEGETTPTPTPTTAQGSITFTIVKSSDPNTPTTSISIDSPAIIKATAKDSTGAVLAEKVMSFSSTFDVKFSPESGTALTDSNGTATITVMAGNTAGAANITASIKDNAGTEITSDTGITVGFPNFSLSVLTITPSTLSAGGTASVSVTVLDGSGNPYATAVPISFTSLGVQQGKATITPQVYTVNGVASATYKDNGYANVDTITASFSTGGVSLQKTGQITVNPADVGSIAFVSATPTNITLKGTGGVGRSETSTVVFKVLDTQGNPIKKTVNFSLNTTVGGLSLTAMSADSDPSTGEVQTIVKSGSVGTPVRVTATIQGTQISTQSDKLVVSIGIPDQNSLSIAASTLNIEGWNYDNMTTDITVMAADRFHNPVPDGTVIYYTTSGGSIIDSCTTANGICTVTLRSQNPRPANGRVVVLAYALGEESFTDQNGNGIYDPGEIYNDMPEPFLDSNENGTRDATELFVDTNANGVYDGGNGQFNGISVNPLVTAPTTIHDRVSITIVFSGSGADITLADIPTGTVALDHCADGVAFANNPVTFKVNIVDVNGNVMPAGTKIDFSTTNGTIVSMPVSWTMPNSSAQTNGTFTYTVIMESDATQATAAPFACTNAKRNGLLTVQVTTPKGLLTVQSFPVTD